jgi:hypothetical protein
VAEGGFDRRPGLVCAGVWWWHRLSVARIPQIGCGWLPGRRVCPALIL